MVLVFALLLTAYTEAMGSSFTSVMLIVKLFLQFVLSFRLFYSSIDYNEARSSFSFCIIMANTCKVPSDLKKTCLPLQKQHWKLKKAYQTSYKINVIPFSCLVVQMTIKNVQQFSQLVEIAKKIHVLILPSTVQ